MKTKNIKGRMYRQPTIIERFKQSYRGWSAWVYLGTKESYKPVKGIDWHNSLTEEK